MPMLNLSQLIKLAGLVSLLISAGYGTLALIATIAWQHRSCKESGARRLPAVSILKPLCGLEPNLYENLRSFCRQDFAEYEIVFGVLDQHDSALAVVKRLRAEFPALPMDVVINARQHGSNRKISNLINMIARARHGILVIADSDVYVETDYLNIVTAPLRDESVGLVTCLYRAVSTRSLFSRLGAMYINDWYMPGRTGRKAVWIRRLCVGADTMCATRRTSGRRRTACHRKSSRGRPRARKTDTRARTTGCAIALRTERGI